MSTEEGSTFIQALTQRADSLEKTLMLGKVEGRRKRGRQRMRRLDGTIDSRDVSLSKLWETAKDREAGGLQSMGSQRVGHNLVTDQQHAPCTRPGTLLNLHHELGVPCFPASPKSQRN